MTWYRTVSIPESKQFMDMFEKQYPLIKVDLLRSGSGEGFKKVFQDIENEICLSPSGSFNKPLV